ncbi:MAG: hypothetical protein Q8P05_02690 [Candidatus Diapherotrites archaeon]|nr:hypothetical protein [Candidatus Diapherotrites archaeon]MDZ4256511.1 hypothetical protein [archaeon]
MRTAWKAGLILLFAVAMMQTAHADLVCGTNVLPNSVIVLKLSSSTNAHAELPTQNNYSVNIYCHETSGVTLFNDGSNNPVTLLKLSSNTNAHGEEPDLTNYPFSVQLGHNGPAGSTIVVNVADATQGQSCASIPGGLIYTEVVRLSRSTNAHLQAPNFVGSSPYDIIICAAYNSGGSFVAGDIIETTIPSSTIFPTGLEVNQTGDVTIRTDNLVDNISEYTRVATLQIVAICDLTDSKCQNLNNGRADYSLTKTEIENLFSGNSSSIIGNSIHLIEYSEPSGSLTYDPIYTAYSTFLSNNYPLASYEKLNQLDGTPAVSWNYTVDPRPTALNLVVGQSYRVIAFNYLAEYDHTSPLFNEIEGWRYRIDNAFTFDFDVVPPSGGGSVVGSGGDIYILKDIAFPNLFRGNNIDIEITAENLKFGDPNYPSVENAEVQIYIRDSKGAGIQSYQPLTQSITFDNQVETFTFTLEQVSVPPAPVFALGETHTAYVAITPYQDRDPTPPDYSETLHLNNTGFRTFAVVQAPQAVSVPDAPWWINMVVLGMVLGFLFLGMRKRK